MASLRTPSRLLLLAVLVVSALSGAGCMAAYYPKGSAYYGAPVPYAAAGTYGYSNGYYGSAYGARYAGYPGGGYYGGGYYAPPAVVYAAPRPIVAPMPVRSAFVPPRPQPVYRPMPPPGPAFRGGYGGGRGGFGGGYGGGHGGRR